MENAKIARNTKEIAITNDRFGRYSESDLVRAGHAIDCKCRRCRWKWMEIEDSSVANGTCHAYNCPKRLATVIDRTAYYTLKPSAKVR